MTVVQGQELEGWSMHVEDSGGAYVEGWCIGYIMWVIYKINFMLNTNWKSQGTQTVTNNIMVVSIVFHAKVVLETKPCGTNALLKIILSQSQYESIEKNTPIKYKLT